jgi:hypothetical protein
VYEQEYHWTLVMLYGLDEVERVDALVADLERNDEAWDIHHAVAAAWGAKTRHLTTQRDKVLRRLRGTPPATEVESVVSVAWPGDPGYQAPDPNKPQNVRVDRRKPVS